ncbi:unnamed protein product [Ixodes hexagonus]
MSTGIPYLGSKISLISKSEIRYEGILYTIDTRESTVALAKVRSFGTEDRPTDRPVAPRDEVYEYIIFRAHDIKDLRVSEPPKPQSTLPGGLTNDPAIVQHSAAPVPGGASGFPAPGYSQPAPSYGAVGTLPSYSVASQYTPQPQQQQSQQLPQGIAGSQQSGSVECAAELSGAVPPGSQSGNTTPAQRKSPTIDAGVQVSVAPSERRQSQRGQAQQQGMGPRRQQQHPQQQHHQQYQQHPQSQQQQHQQHNQHQQQNQHHQQQNQQHQQNQHVNQGPGNQQRTGGRRGGPGGSGAGGSMSAGGRPRQNNYRNTKPKEPLKFDREYDFEQANAEFQELESKLAQTKIADEKKDDSGTETQVGDNHEDDDVVYYDKTKSFFDNISCEAIERSKGMQRIDWRQERKLNHETFGISANNWMRRNAWRGRGSGGFWRGGQRGGGQRGGQRGGNASGGGGQRGGRGGARPRNGAVSRDTWSVAPRAEASGAVVDSPWS